MNLCRCNVAHHAEAMECVDATGSVSTLQTTQRRWVEHWVLSLNLCCGGTIPTQVTGVASRQGGRIGGVRPTSRGSALLDLLHCCTRGKKGIANIYCPNNRKCTMSHFLSSFSLFFSSPLFFFFLFCFFLSVGRNTSSPAIKSPEAFFEVSQRYRLH